MLKDSRRVRTSGIIKSKTLSEVGEEKLSEKITPGTNWRKGHSCLRKCVDSLVYSGSGVNGRCLEPDNLSTCVILLNLLVQWPNLRKKLLVILILPGL